MKTCTKCRGNKHEDDLQIVIAAARQYKWNGTKIATFVQLVGRISRKDEIGVQFPKVAPGRRFSSMVECNLGKIETTVRFCQAAPQHPFLTFPGSTAHQ